MSQPNQRKKARVDYTFLLLFSHLVSDSSATPRAVARQAPLSMGFPRQKYWSGLPFPPPEDLSDTGIKSESPAWQVDSLPLSYLGSPKLNLIKC